MQTEICIPDYNVPPHVEPDISYWESFDPTVPYNAPRWQAFKNLLLVVEVVYNSRNKKYSEKRIMDAFGFEPSMREGVPL